MGKATLEDMRRLEEKHRQQAIEEQKTDAWYVTLIGALFGWAHPLTRLARHSAHQRHEKA